MLSCSPALLTRPISFKMKVQGYAWGKLGVDSAVASLYGVLLHNTSPPRQRAHTHKHTHSLSSLSFLSSSLANPFLLSFTHTHTPHHIHHTPTPTYIHMHTHTHMSSTSSTAQHGSSLLEWERSGSGSRQALCRTMDGSSLSPTLPFSPLPPPLPSAHPPDSGFPINTQLVFLQQTPS